MRDFIFAFIDHCVIPSLLHSDPDWRSRWEDDAEFTRLYCRLSALFFGKPLPALFAAARDWHQLAPELMDLFASLESGDAPEDWLPLIPAPWAAPNGLRLVPLCHPDALVAEGNRLRHCVGGYGAACRYGSSHILSIRGDDGQSVSTVHLDAKDGMLTVKEHSGFRNSPPTEAAVQALDAFMAAAMSGDVVIDYADLAYALAARRRKDKARPSFTALPGPLRLEIYTRYRPLLGKRWARRPIEAFDAFIAAPTDRRFDCPEPDEIRQLMGGHVYRAQDDDTP